MPNVLFDWLMKMDRWQIFLEFLWFHRRFIIGCFLVAGLIFFFAKILPALPRLEGKNRPSNGTAMGGTGDARELAEAKQSDQIKSKQYYLKSTDPGEIVEEAIRLRNSSSGLGSASAKLVVADERFQLAKRALSLTPNLQQRRSLASELTESILMLLQHRKMADPKFDDSEFLAIARKLREDTDDEVRSFASVIITTSSYWNFRHQLTNDALHEFEKVILDHFEQLVRQPIYLRQFCIGLVPDEVLSTPGLELEPVIGKITKRMREHESKETRQIGEEFDMNYGLNRLFPRQLANDLLNGSDEKRTEERINAYFDQLARFPDASIPRHQIALDVVKAYLRKDRHERAGQLLDQYENRILLHREDKESSERIRKALEELKNFTSRIGPRQ